MGTKRAPYSQLCIASILFLGFVSSAHATTMALDTDYIPVTKLGYVILMSIWGALAALLQRFASDEGFTKWRIVVARDLVNSSLAAVIVFLVCDHYKVPPGIQTICFTLAGYGGARFMEAAYSKFVEKIGKVGGGAENDAG